MSRAGKSVHVLISEPGQRIVADITKIGLGVFSKGRWKPFTTAGPRQPIQMLWDVRGWTFITVDKHGNIERWTIHGRRLQHTRLQNVIKAAHVDGRRLLVAFRDGRIALLNNAWRPAWTSRPQRKSLSALIRRGNTVLALFGNDLLRQFAMNSGRPLSVQQLPMTPGTDDTTAAAFSSDGNHLVVAGFSEGAILFDLSACKPIAILDWPFTPPNECDTLQITRNRIIAAVSGGFVLWDLSRFQ